MKKIISCAGLILACLFTTGIAEKAIAQTDSTKPLSLDMNTAIRIALSDNPTVKVADVQIEKQKYANRATIGNLFPTIDASSSYTYTIKKPVMFLQMPGMDKPKGISMGVSHNIQAGITASMPLVSPMLWESISIGNTQMAASLEKARGSKIDMAAEVKKAYLSALLAQKSVDVFKASYENAKTNYRNVEQKYKQGVIAEFDRLRAEVQVQNLEPNLLQAENGASLAKKRLCVLLALDPNTPIELTESLDDYDQNVYAGYLKADTTIDNNSSLRMLSIQDTLLNKAKKIKKFEYLPTLSLSGNYNYSYMNNKIDFSDSKLWTPSSSLMFRLSIPIFSGGKRYYGVKQANTDITMLKLQEGDARRNLSLAMQQQIDLMNTAVKSYSAAKEAEKSAQKGYEIARARYENGAGTILEVNDADVQLLQARLNCSQAVYNFMVSLFAIEQLSGNNLPQ
ncbi:TolC family protein [Falsiporphyromonas endometrii]|uniref:TolC family protein n=1 Tax=Falsiporphyromonas endometrii TaxID=1387297 RepID=A0ABV9K6G0_9PORP